MTFFVVVVLLLDDDDDDDDDEPSPSGTNSESSGREGKVFLNSS